MDESSGRASSIRRSHSQRKFIPAGCVERYHSIQSHNAVSHAKIVDDIGGGAFTIRQPSAILVRSSEAERDCAFLYHQNSPQLFSTRSFHILVGETPTHGSQNARDNSHDKTNEYRVKPSRNMGYSWV